MKWPHVHIRQDGGHSYRHDHRLFTAGQLQQHIAAQHQPRRLPLVRFLAGRWQRGVLDLDTGRETFDE